MSSGRADSTINNVDNASLLISGEDKLEPSQCRDYRLKDVIEKQASIMSNILQGKSLSSFSAAELKNLGLTCIEKSDNHQAKMLFNLALERLTDESTKVDKNEQAIITTVCHFGIATADRELGNNKEAILGFIDARKKCEEISAASTEYNSISYDIERNLGISYLKAEIFSEAALCFKNAIEQACKSGRAGIIPAVTSYYGLSLVLNNDTQKGIFQLETARRLYPKDIRENSMDWAAHRYHMGRAYQKTGSFVKAITEYEESRRLREEMFATSQSQIGSVYANSRLGDCHAGLGQCFFELKQFDEAGTWLNNALANYKALKNAGKIEEIEKLLKTIPANQVSLENTSTAKKYLQYGVVGASLLIGAGLFAYKVRASTIKCILGDGFSARNSK